MLPTSTEAYDIAATAIDPVTRADYVKIEQCLADKYQSEASGPRISPIRVDLNRL